MSSAQWLFEHFRLDPAHACLWRDAEPVSLPPKVFDVLHYLVTHPDRLVTKDELLDAVWPDTAVTEAVVRVAIGALRKALGETVPPRFIATVPRRGYRFLAPVTLCDVPATVAAAAPSPADVTTPPQDVSPPINALAPTEKRQIATVQESLPRAASPIFLDVQRRTPHVTPAGERKQVTVLFADIRDALGLLRDLDPEVVQQLLEPALQAMMDAVHRYGGTVHQMLGDGIMALFGAPIAHEDHVIRACYAALAIQAALRVYAEEVQCAHGRPVQCGIGLNAGEVVIRAIGNDMHSEYSLMGQTTYLAARLEQLAPAETILLTAATVRLVEGFVRVKTWGSMPFKGLAEPVEVCELLGASSRRWRLQTARARGLTRFVGRQTELATLHAALTQAGAGHGQVVAVVGEAGVGKSRLVDEFLQVAHSQGWLVLDSAAVSYSQATPYFPVLDLLRRYCHLEEGDDARTIEARVTEQVLRLDATLQDTIPALLALLDALPADSAFRQLDAPQRRQHTHTALKRMLLRESQGQPLLLVVEDLHWLDTETQALLDSLGDSLPTARLLLLVTYRPDYRHGWGSKTYYTQLRLDPLPSASADAFLQVLLGDDPSLVPLAQLLIQRTEGNPFFLEESVRTLVETGVLGGEPGTYHVVHALPAIQVPATVQAVLAARLDRLPLQEKQLLQSAAVIGRDVPLALLRAIAELPEPNLRQSLIHLQAAEFLYEMQLFPDLEYTFKHALTHEVAYSSLLRSRRHALHARIVAAVERLDPDRQLEHVEQLAYHAFRGEVWDKAFFYLLQAGTKAASRSANREVVVHLGQALHAAGYLPERYNTTEQVIDVRFELQSALLTLGELEQVLDHLREAERLAEALGDHRRLGRVSAHMIFCFWWVGDPDRAIESGQRALATAALLGDAALEALANFRLGQVYDSMGEYRRAIDIFTQTVKGLEGELVRERFGLPDLPSVTCRDNMGGCLAQLGDFAAASAIVEDAIRVAQSVDNPYSLALAYRGAGALHVSQGNFAQAIPLLEHSLDLCRAGDFTLLFPLVASHLGRAYTLSGCVAEGLTLLQWVAEQSATLKLTISYTRDVTWLSEGYLIAGQLVEAIQTVQQALQLARAHKRRGIEADALRLLAAIHAAQDTPDIAQGEVSYQEALALANKLGMRPLQAHCHLGLGTLYARLDRPTLARASLSTAIALYRTMDMTFWLPQAEAVLAQVGAVPASKVGYRGVRETS